VLHGTALNCRVVEVALLQICDFLWDHDAPYHEMYQGTAAVRTYRRKQDTGRKGHLPRLGRASNIEWDLVLRLRRYEERHGLEFSTECSKDEDPGARVPTLSAVLLHGAFRGEPGSQDPGASFAADGDHRGDKEPTVGGGEHCAL
jgi:hypothetical protein